MAMTAVVTAAVGTIAVTLDRDPERPIPQRGSRGDSVGPSAARRPHTVHVTRLLGRSLQRRAIRVTETGLPGRRAILVVGCIHGNEPAGIAVARDLITDPAPTRVLLWVVPSLNPDGVVAGTRQNAHGVDLNRNFPWRWRDIGRPGDLYYSGSHALSEPESQMARRLIARQRPYVSIWFHQQEDVVDQSGGAIEIERRYAFLTHMRLTRLPRYPGSAAGWQDHAFPRTTAFVVELPTGSLSPHGVERFSDAILRLLG